MDGLITDIQRFSLHDGTGIRTTVFFKGCNMRCKWCHNPETLSQKPELLVYPEECIECGQCVLVCESGVRTIKDGKLLYEREKCTACGSCTEVCFSGSLMLSGKYMTVEGILEEVMQDKEYYDKSGGGMTLSGGEVMLQKDFALELLKIAKSKGVSTAIETNLDYKWFYIDELLPYLDLVMFDIKLADNEEHIKWTGRPNHRVLENTRRLIESGRDIIVRTPIIPGVNDKPEAISEISKFLKDANSLIYYELLNFNPLGDGKYNALEMDNVFVKARPLKDDQMERLASASEVETKIG